MLGTCIKYLEEARHLLKSFSRGEIRNKKFIYAKNSSKNLLETVRKRL